ncbi:MAG: NADH-quinone oxidoreductase subunit [Frankiales bacterium]|nr:NADH-quinone oxidoreductase subunit [Frankiales bacterium]
MTTFDVVIALLAATSVGAAALVVTTQQVVHAALWLVVSLAALAGCYVVLAAELVAWVQVLVYVGAVVVLMLFAVMLTRAPIGRSADTDGARLGAAVVATAMTATLVVLLLKSFGDVRVDLKARPAGNGEVIGSALFRSWVLPFELLSLLLLAALVGAVVLTRDDIEGEQ